MTSLSSFRLNFHPPAAKACKSFCGISPCFSLSRDPCHPGRLTLWVRLVVIRLFSKGGDALFKFGSEGQGPGQLQKPSWIAASCNGR
jgi:hypothetical protein